MLPLSIALGHAAGESVITSLLKDGHCHIVSNYCGLCVVLECSMATRMATAPRTEVATEKRVRHIQETLSSPAFLVHPQRVWLRSVAPDPWDIHMSKRQWEEASQHWKDLIRLTAAPSLR